MILLVEDNENDVLLLKRALKHSGLPHPVHTVHDGEDAMNFLRNSTNDSDSPPLPDMVLLDLKLPRMSGEALLEWIRSQDEMKSLPVVAMLSNDDTRITDTLNALGATSWVIKPPTAEALLAAFNSSSVPR